MRKQLLLWVSLPMFALIVIDTTILYQIGVGIIKQSVDQGMEDVAKDVLAVIQASGKSPDVYVMPKETHDVLFSSNIDKTTYAIFDAQGNYLIGDSNLPFVGYETSLKAAYFSFISLKNEKMRLLKLKFVHPNGSQVPSIFYLQIGETLNNRHLLESRILAAIIIPQVILMVASVGLLMWGVTKGLNPLKELNSELSKRSDRQLEPIQFDRVPQEATQLIVSINGLMDKLKHAMHARNRFIADAAHQLRTPLAGMSAQVELALQQNNQSHALKMVSKSANVLVHLVNQLLQLSYNQPEAANVIEFKPVDLFLLAKEVCTELAHYAFSKSIDFGFECASENDSHTYIIAGDVSRLRIMLHNLLDNAIRYTPAEGRVTVSLRKAEPDIVLSVEDNGIGIPYSEKEKVFERFHRVLDNAQEGSGLGLSIVKEVLDLHKAQIRVLTPTDGRGTLMQVVFNQNGNV